MRKTLFQGLKQHNLKHIEAITQEVISDFVYDIEEQKGKPLNVSPFIRDSLLQILYVLIFSAKIDKGDPEMEVIKRYEYLVNDASSLIGTGGLLDIFPFLRFFGNQTYKDLQEVRKIAKYLYGTWKDNVEKGELDGSWFKSILEQTTQQADGLSDDNIMMMSLDFFFGGLVTSSGLLLTLLNLQTQYPEVQDRIRQEVDRVVGQERCVSLADRGSMPYTRACILEVLR